MSLICNFKFLIAAFERVKRRGRTSFNNVLYLVIIPKILFQCVMNVKIIDEIFNILFCTRSWKSDVCFILPVLLYSDRPHGRCPAVTRGW